MSYIEPKCLLKAKNWIQNVRKPSGEIWGLSFAATHSGYKGWMDGVPKITFNCIPKYIKNGTLIQRKKRAKISKLGKQRKKFSPYCQLY